MGQQDSKSAAESPQESHVKERLAPVVPASDTIDPIVDHWLRELVRVAVAIVAREQSETGGGNGSSINT